MKYRPLIGINTDYRAAAKGKTPHCHLHSGYYECLMSANALADLHSTAHQGIGLVPDPRQGGRADADRR